MEWAVRRWAIDDRDFGAETAKAKARTKLAKLQEQVAALEAEIAANGAAETPQSK